MCRSTWDGEKREGARLFSVTPSDRTRCSGHKLKYRKYHLNVRQNYFMVSVVKHQHSLPTEVVDCSSLKIFKTQLGKALGNQL